jgi:periplasmic protein TonB
MHARETFGSSGSKIGKIAIVTALHVAVGLAMVSMKMTTPASSDHPRPIDLLPPTPTPPIPIDPVPVDEPIKKLIPDIFIPKEEVIVIQKPEPDRIVAKFDEKKEIDTGGTKPGKVDESGKVEGGGEAKKERIFTAALANAKDCALPEYPKSALRNGDTGTVSLALLIDTNGRVTNHRIQQSSGFRELDRAAIAALSMCKFKPATTNGVAEPAWGQIAYVWRLD